MLLPRKAVIRNKQWYVDVSHCLIHKKKKKLPAAVVFLYKILSLSYCMAYSGSMRYKNSRVSGVPLFSADVRS
jgi:hypothetical protein